MPGTGVRARVWLDELPDVTYPIDDVLECSISPHQSRTDAVRLSAIEVVRMPGHPSSYGLLGASFTPKRTDRLLIEVASSTPGGEQVDWALAGRCDEVRSGLPKEYAVSVFDAAATVGASWKLGAGVLRFDHAAHGLVGSSAWFFGALSRAVMSLLVHADEPCSDAALAEIVRLHLGGRT